MPQSQTAIHIYQFEGGKPVENIRVVSDAPVPEPAADEVLVNPADIITISGIRGGSQTLPRVPGWEGVGTVESDGKKFKRGTRVVGVPFPRERDNGGSWQQYVSIPEADLASVPEQLSDETASQIYVNPLTVRGFFDVLRIPKGEWLLQSAAGSVLGRQVIQFAKHYGIKTINVVRRAEQKELLDLGADEVIASTGDSGENIAERIGQITDGKGAYAAVDAVGGELTGKLLEGVRPRGTLLIYGILGGRAFTAGIPDVLFHLKVVSGFTLSQWKESIGEETWQQRLSEVLYLLAKGTVTTYNGKTYKLEDVKEAIVEAQRQARGGKVFLKG